MRRKRPIYSNTYTKRRRMIIAMIVAVVMLATAVTGWWWLHRNPRPSARRYPELGVRVDQNFGAIDATELAQRKVSFVYIKATQGASFVDDDYTTNYSRAAELKRGVYHYFSFESTPAQQVANFGNHVGQDVGTLPIGIYVTYYEDPPAAQTLAAHLQQFIKLLNARYSNGVVVMATPSVLADLHQYLPTVATYAITNKRPKAAAYWEYATAKLPGGDKSYHCAVAVPSTKKG